jgi:hypothetical protein
MADLYGCFCANEEIQKNKAGINKQRVFIF